MKISLSKKGDPRGRHLVLSASNSESHGLTQVIITEVLKGKRPIMETVYKMSPTGIGKRRIDMVLYHFHFDYMERLVLTFPHVEMSPSAAAYYRRQSRDIYADLPIPKVRIPGFTGKLWGFQKVGVKWINDHIAAGEDCSLNDDMGLGKTVQVLAAIARKGYSNVLIVTTNQGKYAWKKIASHEQYVNGEVIPPLFPELDVEVADGLKAQRVATIEANHDITVVNVEMLRTKITHARQPAGDGFDEIVEVAEHAIPALFDKTWDLIVVDETHKVKNPDAQVTKGFLRLNAKRGVYMSGTPFLNRPEEMWPVLHRIDPMAWPDYTSFINELVIKGDDNKPMAYRYDVVKAIKKFLNIYTLRRRKDQVVRDLPETVYKQVPIILTDEQRTLYNEIRDEGLLQLENGEIRNIASYLALITRLKQAAWSPELYEGSPHSAKLDQLREDVAALVASGEKAIIYSQWEKPCAILKREFAEYNPAYVTGKTTNKARMAEQDKFNRDEDCKLYIGTIGANQEAITLSAATYVLFTDKAWTPLANAQARDRSASGGLRGAHLAGTGAHINVIEYLAHDTIEEWIEELLATKANLFNKFVENDGGLPVNRVQIDSLREMLSR